MPPPATPGPPGGASVCQCVSAAAPGDSGDPVTQSAAAAAAAAALEPTMTLRAELEPRRADPSVYRATPMVPRALPTGHYCHVGQIDVAATRGPVPQFRRRSLC